MHVDRPRCRSRRRRAATPGPGPRGPGAGRARRSTPASARRARRAPPGRSTSGRTHPEHVAARAARRCTPIVRSSSPIHVDVGDRRDVAEHVLAGRQQRGGQQLQHRVLGAGDGDGALRADPRPGPGALPSPQYVPSAPWPPSSPSTPPASADRLLAPARRRLCGSAPRRRRPFACDEGPFTRLPSAPSTTADDGYGRGTRRLPAAGPRSGGCCSCPACGDGLRRARRAPRAVVGAAGAPRPPGGDGARAAVHDLGGRRLPRHGHHPDRHLRRRRVRRHRPASQAGLLASVRASIADRARAGRPRRPARPPPARRRSRRRPGASSPPPAPSPRTCSASASARPSPAGSPAPSILLIVIVVGRGDAGRHRRAYAYSRAVDVPGASAPACACGSCPWPTSAATGRGVAAPLPRAAAVPAARASSSAATSPRAGASPRRARRGAHRRPRPPVLAAGRAPCFLLAVFATPGQPARQRVPQGASGASPAPRIALFTMATATPASHRHHRRRPAGRRPRPPGRRRRRHRRRARSCRSSPFSSAGWPLWVVDPVARTSSPPPSSPPSACTGPSCSRRRCGAGPPAPIEIFALAGAVDRPARGRRPRRRAAGATARRSRSSRPRPCWSCVLVLVAFPETAHRSLEELNPEDRAASAARLSVATQAATTSATRRSRPFHSWPAPSTHTYVTGPAMASKWGAARPACRTGPSCPTRRGSGR